MHLKQILPCLNEDIHIWNCKVDFNRDLTLRYKNILSLDEEKRASQFKFEKDQIVYTTARGILRLLAGHYLSLSPNEIQFDYTQFGKPFFKTDTSLKFNVSHSGERIAIAFCQNYDIGVDIEHINRDFDVMEIAVNYFSKNEIQALANIPNKEKNRAFYRCWTRKESFIKAEGSGLSFPLDKFSVSLNKDETAELLETSWHVDEKMHWSLFSLVPCQNYLTALAVRKKGLTIKSHEWYGQIST